jgi:hypothetical protein
VAEDHWSGAFQRAVEVVVVAVAEPCGDGADEDLSTDGVVVLDIGDVELIGTVTKDRGAHGRRA